VRFATLSLKLTICLFGGMVIIFAALGYQVITLQRRNLEDSTNAAGDRITDIVKRSTRYGMINNRSDEIHEVVSSIGSQPGIERIRIFNKAGVIRFSTDEHEVFTRVDKNAEACYACHVQGSDSLQLDQIPHQLSREERTRVLDNNGHRTLSVINPIENEPNCSTAACHAHSPDTKILGMINVRMSLEPVDAAISASRSKLVSSLLLSIVALSVVFGGAIWLMVHKPVHQLIIGTNKVAAGDLDYKIAINSRDEVGELASSFNKMTDELKRANVAVNDWARTLEDRVEQKTAELGQAHEHLLRVEKLASIGKLAAIVAHEINNPLAGILVYAKLLLKRALRRESNKSVFDDESRQYLETIVGESARCGEIVKGLLQFSRQTKAHFEPHDLNNIVTESIRLVQHKIDLMDIIVNTDLDSDLKEIVCDRQQIKQALVALLINACEAVSSGGGVVTIRTRYVRDSSLAEISISDNGVGMDEEVRRQIFEPFFTTKEQGKGVGLGLAVVYGIVTGHGGEIDVVSAPHEGTTFAIRLPERSSEPIVHAGLREEYVALLCAVSVFSVSLWLILSGNS
jgi:two-component system NtrC family sensor kinase